MSKTERLKEEIGWYKVIFAILIATIISLLSWFAQNYKSEDILLLGFCLVSIIFIVIAILIINRRVFLCLDKLEELSNG